MENTTFSKLSSRERRRENSNQYPGQFLTTSYPEPIARQVGHRNSGRADVFGRLRVWILFGIALGMFYPSFTNYMLNLEYQQSHKCKLINRTVILDSEDFYREFSQLNDVWGKAFNASLYLQPTPPLLGSWVDPVRSNRYKLSQLRFDYGLPKLYFNLELDYKITAGKYDSFRRKISNTALVLEYLTRPMVEALKSKAIQQSRIDYYLGRETKLRSSSETIEELYDIWLRQVEAMVYHGIAEANALLAEANKVEKAWGEIASTVVSNLQTITRITNRDSFIVGHLLNRALERHHGPPAVLERERKILAQQLAFINQERRAIQSSMELIRVISSSLRLSDGRLSILRTNMKVWPWGDKQCETETETDWWSHGRVLAKGMRQLAATLERYQYRRRRMGP